VDECSTRRTTSCFQSVSERNVFGSRDEGWWRDARGRFHEPGCLLRIVADGGAE
ncbi:hypothetical protein BD626DRAFT_519109, partial [Schizophyllum amplum]